MAGEQQSGAAPLLGAAQPPGAQPSAGPVPPSGPAQWLPVAPPPVRRETPWWVVLVAVLGGLLVLGAGVTLGFGIGYVTGTHHEREELVGDRLQDRGHDGGFGQSGRQGGAGDRDGFGNGGSGNDGFGNGG